ncbi:PREDICTED: F-box/LRR-repeat protein At3g48880-like [Tarenaya hassleriana]|uniref:F-box/LRR-repeat protein At3g48880-like n=1 Tax=Tarenaya hassleriana TaxID=28532 RepID=UPI00053C0E43|nr:PREDICTED: F-box/LRR-repeat protein At3g48880-like [Tarenaya hassleriana]
MTDDTNSSSGEWDKLEPRILVKIFTLLSIMDLISGVSMVCHSWLSACRDPSLWNTIDLSVLTCRRFNTPQLPYAWSDGDSKDRMLHILKSISRISGNNPSTLYFNFYIRLTNEHLALASESFPNLRRVVLSTYNNVTLNGFSNAVQQWQNLESLTLPAFSRPECMIMVIGENCRRFSKLRFTCPFSIEMANAIRAYLPNLKSLSLRSSLVDKEALTILLNGDTKLEVLNLSHCVFRDILRSSFENFYFYRELQPSIIRKASKIKTFLHCNNNSECRLCQSLPKAEFEYREQVWREDEVTELAM